MSAFRAGEKPRIALTLEILVKSKIGLDNFTGEVQLKDVTDEKREAVARGKHPELCAVR